MTRVRKVDPAGERRVGRGKSRDHTRGTSREVMKIYGELFMTSCDNLSSIGSYLVTIKHRGSRSSAKSTHRPALSPRCFILACLRYDISRSTC